MKRMDHAEKLLSLVEEGTSPFHVAANVERQLAEAGFQKLSMNRDWNLENGGKYYLVHNGSTLTAFTIGRYFAYGDDFRIAAAHTDFPGLRIKPSPEMNKDGYRQINVEVYGGAILNTWLDRPLSAAGRVTLRSEDIFHPEIRYVDFRKPFLTIPNLAIHINKDVNKGVELNRQKDLLPVLGLEETEEEGKESEFFLEYLARQLRVEKEDILDYELGLYNTDTVSYTHLDVYKRQGLNRQSLWGIPWRKDLLTMRFLIPPGLWRRKAYGRIRRGRILKRLWIFHLPVFSFLSD